MAGLIKRGKKFYLLYYVGKKQKRVALDTSSQQFAEEKLRQFESAMFCGADNPLPTKTPLSQVIEKYIFQLQARTRDENVKKVVTYIRATFGQISESLKMGYPFRSTNSTCCGYLWQSTIARNDVCLTTTAFWSSR